MTSVKIKNRKSEKNLYFGDNGNEIVVKEVDMQ